MDVNYRVWDLLKAFLAFVTVLFRLILAPYLHAQGLTHVHFLLSGQNHKGFFYLQLFFLLLNYIKICTIGSKINHNFFYVTFK